MAGEKGLDMMTIRVFHDAVQYKLTYFNGRGRAECARQDNLKKDVLLPARDKFFGFLTKFLKKNSSGFLVGDSVTWVDLLIAEHVSSMQSKVPEYLEGFPEVKAHMEKVHSIPKIKKWIESRPASDY
ncbi:glutathione S-transferase protein [Ancylostoma ceylanicum]|uniref:glutathione transferase n=1 Tax=Ancylostoma ceylanicum TaxID=53326 RepID=A0A0D6M9K0_9BILA|nr:glutathione S-transferase protein [Ancylostoma ceylanicum]